MCAGVAVGEGPVEGGDIDAALSLLHETKPGLEDGGVDGAGVKLQTFRDALHQNNAKEGKDTKGKETLSRGENPLKSCTDDIGASFLRSSLTCRGLSRFRFDGGCCSGTGGRKEP